jgi:hypothetical protein
MLRFRDFVNSIFESKESIHESVTDSVKRLGMEDWMDVVKECDRISNKTVLEREFKANWYALKVTSGPWTKGLMGITFRSEPRVMDKIKELVDRFRFDHIIYTSHMSRSVIPDFYGERFIMVPIGKAETIWSANVRDIYSEIRTRIKDNSVDEFPINSYQKGWPTQPLTEVLVDCKSYYLIDPIRFIELSGEDKMYRGSSGKQRRDDDFRSIKTYKDLSKLITEAFNKNKR